MHWIPIKLHTARDFEYSVLCRQALLQGPAGATVQMYIATANENCQRTVIQFNRPARAKPLHRPAQLQCSRDASLLESYHEPMFWHEAF